MHGILARYGAPRRVSERKPESPPPEPVDPLLTQVVKEAAGPLSEGGRHLLARLFGGAADAYGAYLRDKAVIWRAGRGIYTVERAAEMLAEARLSPGALGMKSILTIMEGATLEDNDALTEMWAALLANAATSDLRAAESSFSAILRQLSPTDAMAFEAVVAAQPRALPFNLVRFMSRDGSAEYKDTSRMYDWWEEAAIRVLADVPPSALVVAVDNLIRLGLVLDDSTERVEVAGDRRGTRGYRHSTRVERGGYGKPDRFVSSLSLPVATRESVVLTSLGRAFHRACSAPTPEEPGVESTADSN